MAENKVIIDNANWRHGKRLMMSQVNQIISENKLPSEINKELIQQTLKETNEKSSEIKVNNEEDSYDSSDVFEGLSEVGSDEDDSETADFGADQVAQDITSDQSVKDAPAVLSLDQCVNELRKWVETEAEFYGRTDDEFLKMFLLGCKIDVEKTKTKMTKYYQNRKRLPVWYANRNVNNLENVLQKRMVILFTDTDPHLPTIGILRYARFGNDPKANDEIMALIVTVLDIALRRSNCLQNGAHGIIDCLGYPTWLVTKVLNPVYLYHLAQCALSAPVRVKGVHFINFPLVGRSVWQLCKPLFPKKIKNRVTFSGSDYSPLHEKVDPRLLPIEYGGTNGSLVDHEEAFIQEMHSFSDYFLDDNKYGYQ